MSKVDANIGAGASSAPWVDEIWHKIIGKVERMNKSIGADFPYISYNGKYNSEEADWWTNGFWPGLLWLVYRESKDEQLKDTAAQIEAKNGYRANRLLPAAS